MTDYHALSRTLLFAYLALFTSSLAFFAIRRPPTPDRVKKYMFAVRWLGRWSRAPRSTISDCSACSTPSGGIRRSINF